MVDSVSNAYAILLAGGTGTRLWPVSRELYPKQLVKFIGSDSLVQSTIKRLVPVLDLKNVRVVCGEQHFHEIARHIDAIGVPSEGKIIREPSGRNTAPAILLAAFHSRHISPDSVLCIFPADHVIGNTASFHERLRVAIDLADRGDIVTFGIKSNYPETGYGYIEGGAVVYESALKVRRFVEKPDRRTAEKYIEAGNFFWNSGMFAFKVSVIMEEFKRHQPKMLATMEKIFSENQPLTKQAYDRLENISIDYAIMEKTDKCVVVPSDFGWSDIGSWKSLYDFLPKDADSNVIDGDVIVNDTQGCFIMGRDRLIATNHLENMVVVETPDSIFVSDIDHSRDVKSIVARLKEKGRKEYHQHKTIHFPWGSRTLLEQMDGFIVNRLMIYPASILQTEQDAPATLHLVAVKGVAGVQANLREQILNQGESISIAENGVVSIENKGDQSIYLIQVLVGG
jgi:mannose-1-phosphate guanylyltransferase/mannose-1-phosphate guanylyltransferase/mannose-6-phosphate isomerase